MKALRVNQTRRPASAPMPSWPQFDSSEIAAVKRVIESGNWWRMTGSEVSEFEKEFSEYQSARFGLALTNGTQALEVALAASNIGRGDEVIVPAFSFISTAYAVLLVNAVPVFVDVKPDTYCIDPHKIAEAVTPRTKAVIPVHMAGHAADMDAVLDVAGRFNLAVIEDAAHAQGGEWKQRRVGALQDAGIFSFQAGKLMTAGEGGLIVSNDEEFIERAFLFSSCGRPKTDRTYQHELLGTNCRLSELQAAVLRVQLRRLDQQIEVRSANAPILDRALAGIPGIRPQSHAPDVTRNPRYMYMFRYDSESFGGLSRQAFVDALIEEGIPAFVAYPAMYQTPVFRERAFGPRWRPDDPRLPDYSQVRCPVAEDIGDNVVWLHHRVLLGDEDTLARIEGTIRGIRSRSRQFARPAR